MAEWTSLSVRESTRDRFNELKAEMNDENLPEMSADSFLHSLMDTLEAVDQGKYTTDTDETADYDEFIETMKRIDSSTQTTEERTNQIQRQLEEMTR